MAINCHHISVITTTVRIKLILMRVHVCFPDWLRARYYEMTVCWQQRGLQMAVSYLQMAIHMHVRQATWPAMWSLSLSVSSSLSLALCKQTVQCVCCATKACVVRLPWGPTHYILHSVSHHAASFNCQHIQGTKQFLSMPLQMPSGWKICVSMVIVCLMHKIKLRMKKTTHRVLICTLESICRGAK